MIAGMRPIACLLSLVLAGSSVAAFAQAPAERFLVYGDPQPKSADDVDYFLRDIVLPSLPDARRSVATIVLGDVADDRPALYPGVKAATARLGIPVLFAPGNHDVDKDAKSDAASLTHFHAAFGEDSFLRSFDRANVVVLDDVVVRPGQTPAYVGGLREEQFALLERALPALSKDKLLIVAAHIPFFDTSTVPGWQTFRESDRRRLFALLKAFPHVLLLSAHTHNQRHYFHGARDGWNGAEPLHEYNVGAACGAFWSGVADAAGIPDATMSDGTPNGYATLEVREGGAYDLRWIPARGNAETRMSLHAPKVLRRGAYPAFGVYANVFMGHEGTRVEYNIDGGSYKPMQRVLAPDPSLLAENAKDDAAEALRGHDRSPEATPSTHLWRGTLPTDLGAGEHTIRVRIAGDDATMQPLAYRLDEAP